VKRSAPLNIDRWYASYSVLMTLMFALFVVLYSSAQLDRDRFKALAESLQQAFGIPVKKSAQSAGQLPAEAQNALSARKEITGIKEQVEEVFALEGNALQAADLIRLEPESLGLNVQLRAPQLFKAGRSDLAADVLPLLDRVGRVLSQSKRRVRIEGHADFQEVQRRESAAWALALARAQTVAQFLITRVGISRDRIAVAAQTYEGASKGHQHVEIVITGR
jgi:chemotaxis protein MotB